MEPCSLCDPQLGPILSESEHWRLILNWNQDRHVHMHIVPRYSAAVLFDRETFEDPAYPGHYAVPAKQRLVTAEQLSSLVRLLGD